jgi:hypothetical protein
LVVSQHGIDEQSLVSEVSRRIQTETKSTRRAELARNLDALRPSDPRAQSQVADLMIWLLARRTKADADIASRLIRAVGTKHRSAGRLSAAFEASVDAGYNLSSQRADDLRVAGIITKRKSSWLDRVRGKK